MDNILFGSAAPVLEGFLSDLLTTELDVSGRVGCQKFTISRATLKTLLTTPDDTAQAFKPYWVWQRFTVGAPPSFYRHFDGAKYYHLTVDHKMRGIVLSRDPWTGDRSNPFCWVDFRRLEHGDDNSTFYSPYLVSSTEDAARFAPLYKSDEP